MFLEALWRIIGTSLEQHAQAAKVMDVPLAYIRDLFEGRRKPDVNIVRQKGWGRQLAHHYPKQWEKDGLVIDQFAPVRVSRLKRRRRPIGPPPLALNAFTTALRAIVGDYEDINRLAGILGCNRAFLGPILQGRHCPTHATVMKFNWPEKLAAHYPEAWALHGATFLTAVRELRRSRGRSKSGRWKKS